MTFWLLWMLSSLLHYILIKKRLFAYSKVLVFTTVKLSAQYFRVALLKDEQF